MAILSFNNIPTTNPLWDGLLAYYTADNTPNDSKGTNNGVLMNGATYGTGIINNGFSFDGVNDYVNMGDTLDFDGTTPFSFNLWVKLNGTSLQSFISKQSSAGTTPGYNLYYYVGYFWFRLVNTVPGNLISVRDNSSTSTGQFYNISITYDGSKTSDGLTIKVNNSDTKLVQYNSLTGSISNDKNFSIGSRDGLNNFSNSIIDEVGVWNRVLSSTEETELYNNGFGKQYLPVTDPLWNNLESYYKADNTSNDVLGNNNGTLTNGATYGTGIINQGFSLDGVNDFINMGDNLNIGLKSWTYNVWVLTTNNSSSATILSKSRSGFNEVRWFWRVLAGKLEMNLETSTGGSNRWKFKGATSLSTSVYSMVTVTINRTGPVNMYVNGVADSITTTKANASVPNDISSFSGFSLDTNFDFCAGALSNSVSPFLGEIDEVGIWDRVLTQDEVTELYNSGTGKQYPN
jgi:hypothetical protein